MSPVHPTMPLFRELAASVTEDVGMASNFEPPEGTQVRDALGRVWVRDDGPYGGSGQANWVSESGEHESWTKVSGNYGPVEVLNG